MGLKIFLFVALPIFITFAVLAFVNKKWNTYIAAVVVSFIYFLAFSEGVVYAFCNKIPLIGFLVNPYPGKYKFLAHNYSYNKIYCILLIIFYFVGSIVIYTRINKERIEAESLRNMPEEQVEDNKDSEN